LAAIKKDPLAFERHILLAKAKIEKELPPTEPIFLDRAVPDSIAYFRLENLPAREPLALSRRVRYRRVFLFERLPFEKDRVRWENRDQALQLESMLARAYTDLGYTLIPIPVMPVEQRTAAVLRYME
jgi:predicted ATPase